VDDPDYTLERILPDVIEALSPFEQQKDKKVAVIAGGGIYTGEDIDKYLRMGANGVQMATRFVATHECDAFDGFKQAYLECKKEDITLIDSPVGMPGRAISNRFLDNVKEGKERPPKCSWRCLKTCDIRKAPYCITRALVEAKKGCFEKGFAFAGANAWRIDKICSVKELIESLLEQYQHAVMRLQPNPV
jgi:NAD(P)H-dependent flavin oxidoreductase YrpB (nitropropane dioxygenase family)